MLFLCSISLAAGVVALAFHYWGELEETEENDLWLRRWVIRGMVVPIACWMLFASGLFSGFYSLMPELDNLKGWAWVRRYETVCALGTAAIATYWGAATLLAMLVVMAFAVRNRRDFNLTVTIWSVILLPIAVFFVFLLGWGMAGVVGMLWMFPVFNSCSNLSMRKRPPEYGRAIANMQFGNYKAAEQSVLEQLELNQTDFDGWIMLAELYALHFNDLPAADRTIHEICDEPKATVSQIAVALHKMADWYLKVGQDPVAARRSLEEISRRLPRTHLDRMARVRANQLPRTKAEYLKQQEVKRVRLPQISDGIDNASSQAPTQAEREIAAAQANQLVEKLKLNPNDIAAREKLAQLLAEQLSKAPMALEQMELLLALPGIERHKTAEWLNRMAVWQIRFQHDETAAEALLERVTRLCPDSKEAFTAQRRLNLMRRESQARAVFKPME
jgi:tetratricopeptide (TPR) repeat protein